MNCCFPQQKRKIKTWFQVKIKYHRSNSSGGKLSFHGQIAPTIRLQIATGAPKGEWLIGPAFTQMKLVIVHYIQVSWFAYCHAAPYHCFILCILNKRFMTDKSEHSEILQKLLTKTQDCTCYGQEVKDWTQILCHQGVLETKHRRKPSTNFPRLNLP